LKENGNLKHTSGLQMLLRFLIHQCYHMNNALVLPFHQCTNMKNGPGVTCIS